MKLRKDKNDVKTQAQGFFDWIQLRLKDPNFMGMAFQDGRVIGPMELMRIETPEELMRLSQPEAYPETKEVHGKDNQTI
jgi:hypothetical protein